MSEHEVEIKHVISNLTAEMREKILNGVYDYDVITQGYLRPAGKSGKANKIRARELWNPKEGVRHKLTNKKSKGGIVRLEEEIPKTDEESFRYLWGLADARVRKVRFYIPYPDKANPVHKIELDVYLDNLQGLIVAEVEFPVKPVSESPEDVEKAIAEAKAAAHAFQKEAPHWFDTDVSTDKQYKNAHLATHGLDEKLLRRTRLHVLGIAEILQHRENEAQGIFDKEPMRYEYLQSRLS